MALRYQVNGQKEMVIVAAEKEFGSEFPEEFGGELWRWNMQKGVHVYLKRKCYDLKLVTGKIDPYGRFGRGLRLGLRLGYGLCLRLGYFKG
jgi:hypothetical protein